MKIDSNWIETFIDNILEPATRNNGGISADNALIQAGEDPAYALALRLAVKSGQFPGYKIAIGKGGGIVREAKLIERAKNRMSEEDKLQKAKEKVDIAAARLEALKRGEKPPVQKRVKATTDATEDK